MSRLIAHAGGWDEILIAVGAVGAFVGGRLLWERGRGRRTEAREIPEEDR